MSACRVCGNSESNRVHVARELMLGMGGEFPYVECSRCGCLQIEKVPADLERYYPRDYYSYAPPKFKKPAAGAALRRLRSKLHLSRGALGRIFDRIREPHECLRWLRATDTSLDDAILDVGSGSGRLLFRLWRLGCRDLTGVDPHVSGDDVGVAGVKIFKTRLEELTGAFDLVMFHHSIEHMDDTRAVLAQARRLVRPGRCVLVRTPIAGTWAWKTYGTKWAQLDAPRHLILHTVESLKRAAADAGLALASVEFDSTEFQIWASERYVAGKTLFPRDGEPALDDATLERQRARAAELNATNDGDQACFVLRRA